MAAPSQGPALATSTLGGGLLALSALLTGVLLLGRFDHSGVVLLSAIALAVGACVLAFGFRGGDVVGGSPVGRIALVTFGVAPLLFGVVFALLVTAVPAVGLAAGLIQLAVVTVATVVAAVAVARAGVLRGLARWVLLLVAVDALLTAVMSTVAPTALQLLYMDASLPYLRPIALLVSGLAVLIHGQLPAIRRILAAWRRTTDVGGLEPVPGPGAAKR